MNVRVPVRQSEHERERIAAKNMRSNDRFLNYAHRSIILSVRESAGFGAERMARLVDGAYWIGRGYIDKYSPMAKTDDEYAIDSYYAMRVELGYVGYDPSVELWPDVPFTIADMGLRGTQSASMRAENAFYLEFANKMSFYVREMAAMVALHLHQEDSFGATRIRRSMGQFRGEWIGLMRIYLRKDKAGVLQEMRRMLDRYNACPIFKDEFTL